MGYREGIYTRLGIIKIKSKKKNPEKADELITKGFFEEFYKARNAFVENPEQKEYYDIMKSCLSHYLDTPSELLEILAQDKDDTIRKNVAEHPNTRPTTLAHLASDSNFDVRVNVAKHSNTLPETLEYLAKRRDTAGYLIYCISKNHQTPLSALERLQKRFLCSYTLSASPNVSSQLLDKFAKDSNRNVKLRVAEHPKTKRETLEKLAKGKYKLLDRFSYKKGVDIKWAISRHPNATLEIVKDFINSDLDYLIRCMETLEKCAYECPRLVLDLMATRNDQYSEMAKSEIERRKIEEMMLENKMWKGEHLVEHLEDTQCKTFKSENDQGVTAKKEQLIAEITALIQRDKLAAIEIEGILKAHTGQDREGE